MSTWRKILSWSDNNLAESGLLMRLQGFSKLIPVVRARGFCNIGMSTYDWVKAMNELLDGMPSHLWPTFEEASNDWFVYRVYKIPGITLTLDRDYDNKYLKRADLKFDIDDHTAWVRETGRDSGVFENLDIGGS